MVGHSQLDSDMLQASPHLPAADNGDQVTEAETGSSAEEQEEDNQARGSDDVDDDDGGDEVEEGHVAVPSADAALPLPEPGHRRKRSKLHHRHVQKELLVRPGLVLYTLSSAVDMQRLLIAALRCIIGLFTCVY